MQNKPSLEVEAANFITEGFETADKTLAGACEILIEAFSEDNQLRSWVYNEICLTAQSYQQLKTKLPMIIKPSKFTTIFQRKFLKFKVIVFLALNRGEKLGILKVGFEHNIDKMVRFMGARFKNKNAYIDDVIAKTIKKKIVPAMERRVHSELTESAEDGAIELFSENLRNLLLVSPLKGKWC